MSDSTAPTSFNTMDWAALGIGLAIKYGLQGAMYIMTEFKTVKTIDDAIAALDSASKKTTEQYIAEDAANKGIVPRPLPTADNPNPA